MKFGILRSFSILMQMVGATLIQHLTFKMECNQVEIAMLRVNILLNIQTNVLNIF